MLPIYAEANFDKIAAIGSYYIAAAALITTIAGLILAALAIYFSIKQSRDLRVVEIEQKKFENALDLVRIASGVKDTFTDGSNATFLQIAAVESLSLYPEYIELYRYMRNWCANEAKISEEGRQIHAALVRLVQRVEKGKKLV